MRSCLVAGLLSSGIIVSARQAANSRVGSGLLIVPPVAPYPGFWYLRDSRSPWEAREELDPCRLDQSNMSQKIGKKYTAALKQVEAKLYPMEQAVPLVQKIKFAKFDETVELHLRLGVDPKHADQMVRGTVVLPNGLGKSKKVLVIASGDKLREALEAGADIVGGDDMVAKIQKENWTDFDAVIATPDMMRGVGKLGKILGPRGLMPNPKTGTVTTDVANAVREVKAGKVEFRVDKTGVI